MRIIILILLFTLSGIYFFQNDFDIKTCKYVYLSFPTEDQKLLVCPDSRFRAASGFYIQTGAQAIVLRKTDEETIDHECMHYTLDQFIGADLKEESIQHKIIHIHQLCNKKIKELI